MKNLKEQLRPGNILYLRCGIVTYVTNEGNILTLSTKRMISSTEFYTDDLLSETDSKYDINVWYDNHWKRTNVEKMRQRQ